MITFLYSFIKSAYAYIIVSTTTTRRVIFAVVFRWVYLFDPRSCLHPVPYSVQIHEKESFSTIRYSAMHRVLLFSCSEYECLLV